MAWETPARYVYRSTKFRLTIPYSHSYTPIITYARYVPEFNLIEVEGTYQITSDNMEIEYPLIAKQWGVSKDEKMA